RWTRSTSSRSSPPRSTITVAARRGAVGAPGFSSSPGPGRSTSMDSPYPGGMSTSEAPTAQQWICESCGFIYDPEDGDPDGGIPPGTRFEAIPETWFCPVCGARKRDFVLYEE